MEAVQTEVRADGARTAHAETTTVTKWVHWPINWSAVCVGALAQRTIGRYGSPSAASVPYHCNICGIAASSEA